MLNMIRSVAAMLLLTATVSVAQAAPPAHQARYTVEKSGMTLGEMQVNLAYAGSRYTYLKQTKATGLAAMISGDTLTERSAGTRQGEVLHSTTYLYHHKSKRKDRRDQYSFTSPTQVSGSFEGRHYQLTVPNGTLDPALLELRLMANLAANRPLNYTISERGKVKNYRFQRLGKQSVSVPAGSFQAEVVQMTRDNGERQTTIWLAPELNYAIVKIRHNEKGDIIESKLESYQAR